jgi:hypothetical protein
MGAGAQLGSHLSPAHRATGRELGAISTELGPISVDLERTSMELGALAMERPPG